MTVVTALVVTAPSAAYAGEPTETARASFDEGTRAYGAGEFADAALAFERAGTLGAHASPYLNAAEAWERAGSLERAATACDRGIALAPEGDIRRQLEARLQKLARVVGTIVLSGPATASARVDGGELVHPPTVLRVSPGNHAVSFGGSEKNVSVAAGATERVAVAGAVAAVEAPPRPPTSQSRETLTPSPSRSGGGPPTVSWIAWGVGGAALVTTATFSAFALGARDDFNREPTESHRDGFYAMRTGANIAGAVTLAAAAAGFVIWLAAPGDRSAADVAQHRAAPGTWVF